MPRRNQPRDQNLIQNRNLSYYLPHFLIFTGVSAIGGLFSVLFWEKKNTEHKKEIIKKIKTHLANARRHVESKRYQEAIVEFTNVIHHDPHVYTHYSSRAALHHFLGQHKEAIADVEKALLLLPEDHIKEKAKMYSQIGGEKKILALDLFDTQADSPEGKQLLAEASQAFEKAIQLNPTFSAPYIIKADIQYFQDYSLAEIIKAYGKAFQLDQAIIHSKEATEEEKLLAKINLNTNYIYLGIKLGNEGDIQKAIYYFNEAAKVAPSEVPRLKEEAAERIIYYQSNEHYQDYYESAVQANARGQWDRVIKFSTLIIQAKEYKYPHLDKVYALHGTAIANLHSNTEAIKDFDEAIKINPKEEVYYFNRGHLKMILSLYEEAIKDFNKAIELNPNNVSFHRARAFAYLQNNNIDEAKKGFDKIIQETPHQAIGDDYIHRGIIFKILENPKKAMEDFDKAIALDPNSYTAYFHKGSLLSGTAELALFYFNKAIQAALDATGSLPTLLGEASHTDRIKFHGIKVLLAGFYIERAQTFERLGNDKEAISDFNEALELLNKMKEHKKSFAGVVSSVEGREASLSHIYFLRGEAKKRLGQIDEAVLDYEEAMLRDTEKGEDFIEAKTQKDLLSGKKEIQKSELKKRTFLEQTVTTLEYAATTTFQIAQRAAPPLFLGTAYKAVQSAATATSPLLLADISTAATAAPRISSSPMGFWPTVGLATATSVTVLAILLFLTAANKRRCEHNEQEVQKEDIEMPRPSSF